MKNLRLVRHRHFREDILSDGRLFCIDSQNDHVYFVCSRSRLYRLEMESKLVTLCYDFVAEKLIPSSDSSFPIVDISFFFGDGAVCVCLKSGEFFLYNVFSGEAECVSQVDFVINSVCWSPDQEVVVCETDKQYLIVMTRYFDIISKCVIYSEEFGQDMPVTVGWGKKETQFHGSEGKQAQKEQTKVVPRMVEWDNGHTRISWSGDGQSFVTMFLTPDCVCQLRVWSRDGILKCSSEYLDGLEQPVAWQPSGSLITCSRRAQSKHEIVFFEKNCLQHGGFLLSSEVKVNEILWNSNSTLLALVCIDSCVQDRISNNDLHCTLQIWSVNNYHWYLKQSYHLSSIAWIHWDPEDVFRMHLVFVDGTCSQFSWSWIVNHSIGNDKTDLGVTVVIDGNSLLVTPFRKLVVPPPFCAYRFRLFEAVNEVIQGPCSSSNDFAVVTSDNKLCFFNVDPGSEDNVSKDFIIERFVDSASADLECHRSGKVLELSWSQSNRDGDHHGHFFHHWTWVARGILLFVWTNAESVSELAVCVISRSDDDELCAVDVACVCLEAPRLIRLTQWDTTNFEPIFRKSVKLSAEVLHLRAASREGDAVVVLTDGSVLKYICDEDSLLPWLLDSGELLRLKHDCQSVRIISLECKDHILSLTSGYSFYFDDNQLSDRCTSFVVNGDFVMYTTLDNILYCFPVGCLQNGVRSESVKNVACQRNVERGSSIVVSLPEDTKVVLQMPRGNLETIHPRALVLHSIREHLKRLQYYEALILMKKHRVDMNLLVDNDPKLFLKTVDLFVERVQEINLICLFLTSLCNEDVTVTTYSAMYKVDVTLPEDRIQWTNKVDEVCEAVKNEMEKVNPQKYILAIITAHAEKSQPELDAALLKIKLLRDEGLSYESALKHLLYLVDVDKLYDVALGTYDFDLVLLVAEKSQKDPKEYLPFLNSLKLMTPNYRQYQIDVHLRRYEKALEHLGSCGKEYFEECLDFIKKHNLFRHAMLLFSEPYDCWKAVNDAYADHLMQKNHFDEAGLLYLRSNCLESALLAFKYSVNWKQAFRVAHKMSLPADKLAELAHYFAARSKSVGRFEETALILESYTTDYEAAVLALIEGHLWDSALLLMEKHGRLDMAENQLKMAVMGQCVLLTGVIDREQRHFNQMKDRLVQVRHRLAKAKNRPCDSLVGINETFEFSDTSTLSEVSGTTWSGRGSRFTSKTSRNKKKLDRKRVSLKEGSEFEDVAILETLTQIVMKIDGMKEECGSLAQVLLLYKCDNEAKQIQEKLDSFLKHVISCKLEIWLSNEASMPKMQTPLKLGPTSTANSVVAQVTEGPSLLYREIPQNYVKYLQPPVIRHGIYWKMENLNR